MRLKEFKISAGGKFTPDSPIVIDFTKSKMIGATGDQETGKSTLLDLFLMACGQLGGEEVIKALKNKHTGTIDVDFSFVGNDRADYEVRLTKSKIEVKREGEVKGSPKELLRQMLGVVGVSPMEIKNAPIEDIVKWLASYSTRSAEEFEKEMNKIKNGIKDAKKDRAAANNSTKGLRNFLKGEGIIDETDEFVEKKWAENETKFKVKPDIDKLSGELKAAGGKSDKFIQFETKLISKKDRKKQIEDQIKIFQKELAEVDQNIKEGDAWIEKNKTAKKDYDDIKKRYDNVAKDAADYNKWEEVKKKKKEMDEFQDAATSADGKEKNYIKKQQELQWEVIPDIRGVEIVLEDTHEDEGEQKKAGFYYNGFNSRQLSASEWFGVVAQILKKNKIKIIIIDDISQLGSKFIEVLEKLVKDGCYVLYTEMARGQEQLEIEYKGSPIKELEKALK